VTLASPPALWPVGLITTTGAGRAPWTVLRETPAQPRINVAPGLVDGDDARPCAGGRDHEISQRTEHSVRHWRTATTLGLIAIACVLGVSSQAEHWRLATYLPRASDPVWRLALGRRLPPAAQDDAFGRQPVVCPAAGERTSAALVFGQSQAANWPADRRTPPHSAVDRRALPRSALLAARLKCRRACGAGSKPHQADRKAAHYAIAFSRVFASAASLRASILFICSVPHSQRGASAA
jgi:hypothetical protein